MPKKAKTAPEQETPSQHSDRVSEEIQNAAAPENPNTSGSEFLPAREDASSRERSYGELRKSRGKGVPVGLAAQHEVAEEMFRTRAQQDEARKIARSLLRKEGRGRTVGKYREMVRLDAHTAVFLFESALAGYPGWFWSVTVTKVDLDSRPTVIDTGLIAGVEALLPAGKVSYEEQLKKIAEMGLKDLKELVAMIRAQRRSTLYDEVPLITRRRSRSADRAGRIAVISEKDHEEIVVTDAPKPVESPARSDDADEQVREHFADIDEDFAGLDVDSFLSSAAVVASAPAPDAPTPPSHPADS